MAERRYDAFDNLVYLAMKHFQKHGSSPSLVKLPLDEAELLIRCRHSGVRSLQQLRTVGVAGMAVEIDGDPDAKILLLK